MGWWRGQMHEVQLGCKVHGKDEPEQGRRERALL